MIYFLQIFINSSLIKLFEGGIFFMSKQKIHSKEYNHSRNIFIAFILNLGFSIIEFIGGIFTNSISIISDSIHDFGDAITIAISWVLERKSKQKPNYKYTFGYTRYSVLGAFITSTVLLIGSAIVIYNGITRIINPVKVNYDGMLIFAILGLVSNGIGAFVTSHGEKLNEKAVSLHLLEDLLGWIAVLITSVIMKIFDVSILDPILSIGITIYILWHVIENYKRLFSIFLEKAPDNVNVEYFIKEVLENNHQIQDIHHIHLWALDDINNFMSCHVVFPNSINISTIKKIKRKIKHSAIHHNISHITLEIEFENEMCNDIECTVYKSNSIHSHHHHHHH